MKRIPLLPLLVLAVILSDQITKLWVADNLAIGQYVFPVPSLANILAVTHVQNTGVAFGLFRDANALFAVLSVVVMFFIARYLRGLPRDRLLLRFALGLLLAGAGGNLIDRLRLGYVTDFIAVGSFARFNVADSALSIGLVLLAIGMLRENRQASSDLIRKEQQEA